MLTSSSVKVVFSINDFFNSSFLPSNSFNWFSINSFFSLSIKEFSTNSVFSSSASGSVSVSVSVSSFLTSSSPTSLVFILLSLVKRVRKRRSRQSAQHTNVYLQKKVEGITIWLALMLMMEGVGALEVRMFGLLLNISPFFPIISKRVCVIKPKT